LQRALFVCHEEFLQILETVAYFNALFLSFHERRKPLGYFDFGFYHVVYYGIEFGRVCRLEEHSRFARFEQMFQCTVSACPVWVEDIAVFFVNFGYG